MTYANAVICILIGGVPGSVLNDATKQLPEYGQDSLCRSVCTSYGECLSHRGVKLRADKTSSRRTGLEGTQAGPNFRFSL